jgi:hypothetical protein
LMPSIPISMDAILTSAGSNRRLKNLIPCD